MKKITISITSKNFDITLEDGFAIFFENEISTLFKKNNIDIKDLLGAFVQECYLRYKHEESDKQIIKSLENIDFKECLKK